MALQLRALLDIPRVQSMVDLFYQLTGIPVGLADEEGTILLASRQPDVCADFFNPHHQAGRVCQDSNRLARVRLQNEDVCLVHCANGFSNLIGRVTIDQDLAGILFVGPFFRAGEEPSESTVRRKAAGFGFDEETFVQQVRQVPVLKEDQFRRAQAFIHGLAGFLAEIGTTRRQQEVMEEERQHVSARAVQAQKMESLGLLAGGIAHDFNNLLMGVLGNAGLAKELLPPPSPARPYLEQIEATAQRMADLTRQLLAYAGRAPFSRGRLDLNRLVLEMKDLLRFSIGKKTTLRLHLSGELLPVEGDATQLRQVVMNLIANAAEALGENEGLITIASRGEDLSLASFDEIPWRDELKAGPFAVLEVTDTGCGIPPEALNRVFDPFFSTKFVGRGLGLSALQGVIRAHRGAVRVSSAPGRGTTVSVFLPLHGKPLEETAGETPVRAPEAAVGPGGRRAVLVVDGEDVVRSVMGAMLSRLGYEVLQAGDGDEGLQIFRERGPAIKAVLLDLAMPCKTGVEVFDEIHRLNPDTPVVLMSGSNEQETAQRFSAARPAAILTKPFRPEDLQRKLGDLGLMS